VGSLTGPCGASSFSTRARTKPWRRSPSHFLAMPAAPTPRPAFIDPLPRHAHILFSAIGRNFLLQSRVRSDNVVYSQIAVHITAL
jgi:hypothetical protein